jgi:two-component system alkaline phosphatase synthesis response regulator PhoP
MLMARERILVVEDDEDIRELVRYNLAADGYDVICAETGEEALDLSKRECPDLALLDLMLPGIDGVGVCRTLRTDDATKRIAIIMLTAKAEEADIVAGLELGADDYITKPFSPRVLIARVRTVLRRTESLQTEGDKLQFDDLVIHPGRHQALVDGEPLDLSATEFRLLHHLALRPGWVSTRSQIIDSVHGPDYPVTDRSVDVQIVGLRKKMGALGERIETVRGIGYRFKE